MNLYSKIILFSLISLNYYPQILSINFNNFFAPENNTAISKAFKEVIDVFMGQRTDILVIKDGLSDRSNGVFQNLITQNDGKFKHYIGSIQTLRCEYTFLKTNLVIFLRATRDNLKCYHNFYKLDGLDTTAKVIMYIDDLSLIDVKESGATLQTLIVFSNRIYTRTYFVVNELDYVYLATFEWYSKHFCNKPNFIILNVLNKSSGKWNRKLQKHDKFMDYHGCELVLFMPTLRLPGNHVWGYSVVNENKTNFTVHGIIPELFRIASTKFNFKAEYQPVIVHSNRSFLIDFERDSAHIILINGTHKEPNVCIEVLAINTIINTQVVGTYPFMESVLYLLVTPAEEYTPYEKLLLPFDEETWILLVLTFTLAFCAIILINKLSRKVQNVFYGSRVKTPLLNLTSIFFGISQTQLPSGNFSRQILIIFVYFCLIFRTCFQSRMFEFFVSTPTHSSPKTLQELVDKNYTVYTQDEEAFKLFVRDEIGSWPRIKQLTLQQYYNIYHTQSRNASAKIALEIQNIYRINQMTKFRKDDGWRRLNDDNLLVAHGTFAMRLHSFYFNMITKTVNGLRDTGVFKYLVDRHIGVLPKFPNNIESEVLTVRDFKIGFIVWLGLCATSIVCFAIEILILKLRIWCKRLKLGKCVEYARVRPRKVRKAEIEDVHIDVCSLERFKVQKGTSSNCLQILVPAQNQIEIPCSSKRLSVQDIEDEDYSD